MYERRVFAMLKTYKDHLKRLSKMDMDNFSKRVQLRLRYKIKVGEEKNHVEGLKSLILVMPDLIGQIQAWLKEKGIPQNEKNLIGYLLTYLHHPMDVIPYHSVGLFGHLEEAYLTGTIFKRIASHLSNTVQPSTSPGSLTLIQDVPVWLNYAKKVIPSEAAKMEKMIDELVHNQLNTFNQKVAERFERPTQNLNNFLGSGSYTSPFQGQYAAG
jgi:uncharacterized membrane protein YkvA (DUF1232 family)